MPETLVRKINAVVFAVTGSRHAEQPPPEQPPDTWILPDSQLRAQRVVIPDARRMIQRQQSIIYTQSVIIAILLVGLLVALSALRWT